MSEHENIPDEGVTFDYTEPEKVAVEEAPEDPTGDRNTEDAVPQSGDAETTEDATDKEGDVEKEKTEPEKVEPDQLSKMQHSMRVKAYENRELKRRLKFVLIRVLRRLTSSL